MSTITVKSQQPYDVVIGQHLENQLADTVKKQAYIQRVVVMYQEAVYNEAQRIATQLTERGLNATLFPVPYGESSKTPEMTLRAWNTCAEAGLSRTDAIVGVGGGATTDFSGFIAATWMRGINVYQYPTTLLGMVDAAVGGKTGINIDAGKNLVGAFHEPTAVFCDTATLKSLPQKDMAAGSAEIVKAGFISDPEILKIYESSPAESQQVGPELEELIQRAILVKANVVSQDLKESLLREILNYGHTFGHAVEKAEHYQWRHGDAVSVGMIFEAELAHAAGLLSEEDLQRHYDILESLNLPTRYSDTALGDLLDTMQLDKKNKNGTMRFAVIQGIADPVRLEGPDRELLNTAYDEMNIKGYHEQ